MLKNYIKIAWRNLWKNKTFSIINILGLSIGIAFSLLIGAYVWGELQVNRQLKNIDNQYIILSKWKDPNMGFEIGSSASMPKALKDTYPGLVANNYHCDLVGLNVSKGDKHFHENLQVGDSTLFDMYGFKLLYGNTKTALNDPFSVVITTRMALKYFGKSDVLGQTINVESFSGEKHDFIITGVLPTLPQNSVTELTKYRSEFFFNANTSKFLKRNIDGWDNTGIQNYVELQPGINPKRVDADMHSLLVKNASKHVSQNLTPYLVSLKDYNQEANGGIIKKMIWTLSCIALFILMMAMINFVNICIGRASGRMKEMGIRKVMGSLRKQLILQFLAESTLLVIIATVFALVIYLLARPFFSDIIGKDITSLFAFPFYFWLIPVVFALILGLLAGIYPALVLSSLKSVDSLKGKLTSVKESVLFRKSLVVFQFSTAAVVLISAIIISKQINLFFSNNLGYNKDYIITAHLPLDWSPKGGKRMETIRYKLASMPQVKDVSLSYEIPNGNNAGNYSVYRQGANPSQTIVTQGLNVDDHYASTYNISLKAGHFFNPVFNLADSADVVINETQAKALGFKSADEAIGQKIMSPGNPATSTICGVTSDFHFGSMQAKILPVTFTNVNYNIYYRYFSIKIKPGDIQQSVVALQKKWAELMPGAPFEYKFMDDNLKDLYSTELQLKKAANIATFLAVIIVLLGVLGLISLSIQKRTKEIGIRKVLGSSAMGITLLFFNDFLGLVLIAAAIACPLAYLIMQKWLSDYAYKIDISVSPFIFSIVLLTGITAILIILQTIKAASTNPIKSLRT